MAHPAPRTKAGEYDDSIVFGDAASTAQDRSFAASLLVRLKEATAPARRVFPVSLHTLDARLRCAVRPLGIERLRLTPHTARHGGASTDFASDQRPIDSIQRRGRWKAIASVRRYEKAGRLNRQIAMLSPAFRAAARREAALLPSLLMKGLTPRSYQRDLGSRPKTARATLLCL